MATENELTEMMVSDDEKCEHDDKEIEELIAEIDRKIKELEEISPEEKLIMTKIREVLDEHELKYFYDEDEPKCIKLGFSMDNKPFNIHIILQNGKVIFRLSFPFRVQSNAITFMSIFMAEFNKDKAFSVLNLDPDDGELTMEYSYMLEDSNHFNEKYFWVYMTSLIHPALEIYTKVAHLSVGMISGKDRKLYKQLLKMAMETINGDFDDDNVCYGTESLESDSLSDFSDLFGKDDGDEGKKDDSDSDDEDITSDIIQRLRSRRRASSFEEFMRMKTQAEENEEETEDQPKKVEGMLSMFAKRDKDKEPQAVGGNADE